MDKKEEEASAVTTINFSITKCPIVIHKRFVDYCKKESNDNYSFGLKLLLDGMDGNVKEATLFQQYIELKGEMKELKEEMEKLKKDG